jgi:transcriptional regulator with XRE-family HTH domain
MSILTSEEVDAIAAGRTPVPVSRAQRRLGENLASWRKLRRLTVAEVADRADVGVSTVVRLENGRGASLENVLRVARALGVLEPIAASVDPYTTELGQLRADEALPRRVRSRKAT